MINLDVFIWISQLFEAFKGVKQQWIEEKYFN